MLVNYGTECLWLWWIMMQTQEVLQRIHSTSKILVYQVAIYLNGEIPAPALKLNFADNQYIDGYRSLFITAGQIEMDNGLNVMRADYRSSSVF